MGSFQIKFRAWDKTLKRMIYPNNPNYQFILTDKGLSVDDLTFVDTAFNEKHEDIDCEVMQSTGLEDKNRVEIYEGDIVSYILWLDGEKRKTIVANVSVDKFRFAVNEDIYGDIEVIGNIYENPELVKELKNEI